MKLTFLGAAHEVTGSRFLLEACGKYLLVDYGMEQGVDIYPNAPLPVQESQIDYVLLTHAHIDHSGYLPLLYKNGFRGSIYATKATTELCGIMLLDSAHIQESDAEWKNRRAQRSGKPLVEPLYTQSDALETCKLFKPCEYAQPVDVCPGIAIRMVDVGHLLGSASIEVTLSENGHSKTLVFSGDIGNLHQPLLRDPQYMQKADYLIMESTYGDRTHGPTPDYLSALTQVLQTTLDKGGNIIIPSFAVGRTQEMLYFIRQIKQEGRVTGHDHFPVYVDSPLAIQATNVFNENTMECADEDTLKLLRAGVNPITFDGLRIATSADESKLINENKEPKVIISASGMCDAGRVRHHLKHNLWRPECTVLFVGYQSVGTLGRSLVDGAKQVRIFDETIEVRASVEKLAGVSGHADVNGLLKWASTFDPKPQHVFVVHGEDESCEALAARLRDEQGLDAQAPYNGESWELDPLTLVAEGNKERLKEKKYEQQDKPEAQKPAAQKPQQRQESASPEYALLTQAMQRLQALVDGMQNRARKEQGKLAKQLNILLKRFGRR